MYNEDIKNEYLNRILELGNSRAYVDNIRRNFEKVTSAEEKLQKDIRDFTESEILSVYVNLNLSTMSLVGLNTSLRGYVYDVCGEMRGFSRLSQKFIREKFSDNNHRIAIDYSEIVDSLDKLENAPDKFLLYALFCGIKGEVFVELAMSTLNGSDPDSRTIWLADFNRKDEIVEKGRLFYADELLYSLAIRSSQTKYIYQTTKAGVRKRNPVVNSQTIYKVILNGTRGELARRSMRNRIESRLKVIFSALEFPKDTKPEDIYYSGFMCHLNKLAAQNGFQIINSSDIDRILNTPGIEEIINQYQIKIQTKSLKEKLKRYI